MSKKYKEEINSIVMNDAMKKRILQNVLAANEADNSAERNMKAITTIPKAKKNNNVKRNMQMVAAGFTVVLCLSVAKNYPMLFNHATDNLEQKETSKSPEDENNNVKTSDNNESVYDKDSKEIPDSSHKEEQVLEQNNNKANNADSYVKEENNVSPKVVGEEKSKDASQSKSSSQVEKKQSSQNNNGSNSKKVEENSSVSAKASPKAEIYNTENKNPTATEPKAKDETIKQNKISDNNIENSDTVTSAAMKESRLFVEEYKTLDEAEKALNLKVNSLKNLPKAYKMESINVIAKKVIQVEYNDGNNYMDFRAGKEMDNIIEDYNTYTVKKTVKVNGINVNLGGNENNKYNLASWEKDGISYSISLANSVDEKTILDMIG